MTPEEIDREIQIASLRNQIDELTISGNLQAQSCLNEMRKNEELQRAMQMVRSGIRLWIQFMDTILGEEED